jgi:hypothetical protein
VSDQIAKRKRQENDQKLQKRLQQAILSLDIEAASMAIEGLKCDS